MKRIAYFSILMAFVLVLGACGGKSDSDKTKIPPPTPPAPGAPAATAPAAAPSAPAGPAKDALHQKLVGSHWMVGDFDVTFQDSESVLLKGGPLAQAAPNGLKAKYSYENGIIKVTAMGTTKTGTWDGDKLVVDGKTGERQSQ